MKYEIIQGYNAKEFRSVTGVTPGTFSAMLECLLHNSTTLDKSARMG